MYAPTCSSDVSDHLTDTLYPGHWTVDGDPPEYRLGRGQGRRIFSGSGRTADSSLSTAVQCRLSVANTGSQQL